LADFVDKLFAFLVGHFVHFDKKITDRFEEGVLKVNVPRLTVTDLRKLSQVTHSDLQLPLRHLNKGALTDSDLACYYSVSFWCLSVDSCLEWHEVSQAELT